MKIIFIFLLVMVSCPIFSQEYKYTLTLPDAIEEEVIKKLSKTIYEIFDQSAEFEQLSSQFIILSEVDITEAIFLQKMEDNGFKRLLFTKQEIISTINQ